MEDLKALRAIRVLRPLKLVTGFESKWGFQLLVYTSYVCLCLCLAESININPPGAVVGREFVNISTNPAVVVYLCVYIHVNIHHSLLCVS